MHLPLLSRTGFSLAMACGLTTLPGNRMRAEPSPPESGRILFVVGEREYGTRTSLPRFAREVLAPRGYESEFIFARSDDRNSPDCHAFPGLAEALDRADLLVISARRRFLNKDQTQALQQWMAERKPILGLRTASHAFAARRMGTGYVPGAGQLAWDDFDRDVFGADYEGHSPATHGATRILHPLEVRGHPMARGLRDLHGETVTSSLYYMRNLADRARILLTGHATAKRESLEPVSWTLERDGWRTFYTSLGDETHFSLPWFQQHLVNAVRWTLTSATDPNGTAGFLEKDYEAAGQAISPADSLAGMVTPGDLAVDLLAAEPTLQQPAFLNFDERGRIWVVEYRQYPKPAGLKLVSRDQYWRNVYDRKPAPPGHPDFVSGQDRISIYEDSDGDGHYDRQKIFVDGLNLATACVKAHDGLWVLNPPYLLFYPDHNEDDVPDGDPQVHLDGFGIQDTHALVNSLGWGPDGWLYASQGSTVSSDVKVVGSPAPPVSRVGQLIWRYHPGRKQYEVFAEGGGNIWSCEIDSRGRIFAGTNDRHPAYAYRQGAFYRKNFGKHGALSNPHAFGHFEGIDAPGHRRVSTSVLIYEGAALPSRYDHALFYLGVLQGKVGAYHLEPAGLNFRGDAIDLPLNATDRWFRPVYVESGPDGAVYVCDWYDQQVNHYRNHEGAISKSNGRLFRIRGAQHGPVPPFDLRTMATQDLVDLLYYRNRWWREQARQQLRWRTDRFSVVPRLRHMLTSEAGQPALEAWWALHLLDAAGPDDLDRAMFHANPDVRRWAIRMVGDSNEATDQEREGLLRLAATETDLEILSQLAASAGRLPRSQAMPLLRQLMLNPAIEPTPDLNLMIWWNMEPRHDEAPEDFIAWFAGLVRQAPHRLSADMVNFVMRRTATAADPAALQRAATLFNATDDESLTRALATGLATALTGRSLPALPPSLIAALSRQDNLPLSLRLRMDPAIHLPQALDRLSQPETDSATKVRMLEILAENAHREAVPIMLRLLRSGDEATVIASLHALQAHDSAQIAEVVIERLPHWSGTRRDAAETLLIARPQWSRRWLEAIATGPSPASLISSRARQALRDQNDPGLNESLHRIFGRPSSNAPLDLAGEIARIRHIVSQPGGVPQDGWNHYQQRCAACHVFFEQGGRVGPDLTAYQRDQLDTLLLSIIHPDAEIREGFEMTTITTTTGRVLSGFPTRNEPDWIALQMVGGAETVVTRDQIESITLQPQSLMPTGLLQGMDDQSLRDLIAFLQIRQPLDLKF